MIGYDSLKSRQLFLINLLRKYWNEYPLVVIMMAAVLFRLLAAIFSMGWGMLDDHYLVIESSGSWTDGFDYNAWLPGSKDNHGPTGHNLFYPGIHFLLFQFLNLIHITDPQWKMFIVRLLHGALSLITVYFGYRLAERIDGKKSAKIVGILLALFWFMPWLSVRNLVEMVSVPFLILGYWFIFKQSHQPRKILPILMAGIWFGIAFNIRPQTVFFPLGIGLIMLFQRSWRELFALSAGSLAIVILVQGGIDLMIWGRPFAEMQEYVNVCFSERTGYINLPWYNYILTLSGMLIPPVSLYILFGFATRWKRELIIFLPVLLFLLFHSYFPNKQERFIIPAFPFLILLGIIGWNHVTGSSRFWQRNHGLLKGGWIFFWVINTIALLIFTFSYSKRAQVESMHYLSRYPDIQYLVVLDKGDSPDLFPKFYLGQWPGFYSETTGSHQTDSLLFASTRKGIGKTPRFVLFTGEGTMQEMVIKARNYLPYLVYETTIYPGLIDRALHKLNPHNKNMVVYIYRNAYFYPKKIE